MQAGPRLICSLLIAKPHVVARSLGKLLKKVTQEGFSVIGMRQVMLSEPEARHIVPAENAQVCPLVLLNSLAEMLSLKDEVLCKMHVDYLMSAPCVLLCVQRENAVKHLLDLVGPEDPASARRLSSFLWRGVFGTDAVANALYSEPSFDC
jgi:nucleoside diphosphate kinase